MKFFINIWLVFEEEWIFQFRCQFYFVIKGQCIWTLSFILMSLLFYFLIIVLLHSHLLILSSTKLRELLAFMLFSDRYNSMCTCPLLSFCLILLFSLLFPKLGDKCLVATWIGRFVGTKWRAWCFISLSNPCSWGLRAKGIELRFLQVILIGRSTITIWILLSKLT